MSDGTVTEYSLDVSSDGMEAEDLGDGEETQSGPFDPKKVDIQVMSSIMDAIIKRLRTQPLCTESA